MRKPRSKTIFLNPPTKEKQVIMGSNSQFSESHIDVEIETDLISMYEE